MKYTINHACGHEKTYDGDGRLAGAKHKRRRLERDPGVCYECKQQQFTDALQSLEKEEMVLILNELRHNREVQRLVFRSHYYPMSKKSS